MRLNLEIAPDEAVLIITEANGDRTEVRGNPRVGTDFIGDTLDRLLAILAGPPVSVLFAGMELHLRTDQRDAFRAFLLEEDRLVALILASELRR